MGNEIENQEYEKQNEGFEQKKEDAGKNPLLADMEATFEKCLGIAKRKNADYGGGSVDPYKNFMGSLLVGVDPKRAVLVRITDKLSRVSTLLGQEAQVKDEAIEDTIDDAINYFAILKSCIKRGV